MLALRGIATTDLTSKIGAHLKTTQDDLIPADEMREKITKAYLGLIAKGRKEVWLPRNEAAILYQKHILNITAKDKHEPSRTSEPSAAPLPPSRTPTVHSEMNQPTVLVTTSDLNQRYDAYHCNCGQHSLLHTPGNRCDGAGLILDRATDITTSCRHRNVEIIPLIFTTQVLSWTALRLP